MYAAYMMGPIKEILYCIVFYYCTAVQLVVVFANLRTTLSILLQTLTFQLVLISDIATTRSYVMFIYESFSWKEFPQTSIGYITRRRFEPPLIYTHPDTTKESAYTLDVRPGNTGRLRFNSKVCVRASVSVCASVRVYVRA